MHARVVTIQIRPGELEGAIAIYRDSVVLASPQALGGAGTTVSAFYAQDYQAQLTVQN